MYIVRVPWNVGRDSSGDLVSLPRPHLYTFVYIYYIYYTVPGSGSMSVVFGKTILPFPSECRKYNVCLYLCTIQKLRKRVGTKNIICMYYRHTLIYFIKTRRLKTIYFTRSGKYHFQKFVNSNKFSLVYKL